MKNVKSKRILAKDTIISNDTWITGINNNDLIVGPSGAGKTRGYVIPNLLYGEDSMIVADTKGNLHKLYGKYLQQQGYKVMCLDFTDTAHSPWGYNPLNYIRRTNDPLHIKNGDRYNEQDIKKLATAMCPVQNNTDPFWDYESRHYLETIILYVMNYLSEKQHNLYEVYTFLTHLDNEEFRDMLDGECEEYPDSSFARKYKLIKQNAVAERMHASVIGILAQHLDVVSYSGTRDMFRKNRQVDMGSFLERRTALFLNVSDSDRSQDNLVNLFYTQAMQYLLNAADKSPDSRLPIPVRFILDDFSTNTVIPDFDKIISVIRSREIYVSLIIQSISQLEGLYEKSKSQTIINNCDHCLYLGGTDVETAKYFGTKFNCQTSTILNLPLNDMYLFTRGSKPVKVTKYELGEDKVYKSLSGNVSAER